MIKLNRVSQKKIADYRAFFSAGEREDLKRWAKALAQKKIIHLNATPKGGGVAEILKSLIPLEQDLGLQSFWYSLEEDARLFTITKKLHNALQGQSLILTAAEKKYYLSFNAKLALAVKDLKPDILMIHDPQPLPVIDFLPRVRAAIRIHIDLTAPQSDSMAFIRPLLQKYQKVIFSMREYAPRFLSGKQAISPPAIDPLSEKNRLIPLEEREKICRALKINPQKKIILQVARFDPWKDPLGVIEAFRIVRNKVRNVQLILAGIIEAQDDPEAAAIFEKAKKQAAGDPDIIFYSRPSQVGKISIDRFVNVLQRSAAVVFQKSLREGFGLTVAEAMWKEKPVIGGNAGGIKLQITDGQNGFLVSSAKEAAEKAVFLLNNPNKARDMGQKANKTVAEKYLITRLLGDELNIMQNL